MTEQIKESTQEKSTQEKRFYDFYDEVIEEGLWIEKQIETEKKSGNRACPACQAMFESLNALNIELTKTVTQADEMLKKDEIKLDPVESVIHREYQWYCTTKDLILDMFKAAHKTKTILSAHRNIRKKRIAKPLKKKQRHAQRIARRRTRTNTKGHKT
jgi:hypothetical protein